jgi:hypothetical protein
VPADYDVQGGFLVDLARPLKQAFGTDQP